MKKLLKILNKADIKRVLLILIIFNLLLKIILMFFLSPNMPPVDDGKDYFEIAENLITRGRFAGIFGITSVRAPLYPFFLSLLFLASGGDIAVMRIIQILISLTMIPLIYLLLKKLDQKKPAVIIALFIYSFYPAFIYLPYRLLTENLFIILLMIFSLVFLKYRGLKDCAICGITAGLLSLTRPMFLLYPIFALIYIFYHRKKNFRLIISDFLVIVILMALTILPWTIRNYMLWGGFCLITTNSGNTVMINNNDLLFDIEGPAPQNRVFKMELLHPDFMPGTPLWDSMNELQRDRELQKRTFAWIKNNPGSFLRLIPIKIYSFWHYSQNPQTPEVRKSLQDLGSIFSYLALLPFMIYGFFKSFKYIHFPDSLYPLSLLLLFLFTTIIFGGSLRFRMPFDIFLIIWGSIGMYSIILKLAGKRHDIRS